MRSLLTAYSAVSFVSAGSGTRLRVRVAAPMLFAWRVKAVVIASSRYNTDMIAVLTHNLALTLPTSTQDLYEDEGVWAAMGFPGLYMTLPPEGYMIAGDQLLRCWNGGGNETELIVGLYYVLEKVDQTLWSYLRDTRSREE